MKTPPLPCAPTACVATTTSFCFVFSLPSWRLRHHFALQSWRLRHQFALRCLRSCGATNCCQWEGAEGAEGQCWSAVGAGACPALTDVGTAGDDICQVVSGFLDLTLSLHYPSLTCHCPSARSLAWEPSAPLTRRLARKAKAPRRRWTWARCVALAASMKFPTAARSCNDTTFALCSTACVAKSPPLPRYTPQARVRANDPRRPRRN